MKTREAIVNKRGSLEIAKSIIEELKENEGIGKVELMKQNELMTELITEVGKIQKYLITIRENQS